MDIKQITIRQLDDALKNQALTTIQAPKIGWVRTIRKALGMTIKQLAQRLQVNPSRVVRIEADEVEGGLTLRSLRNAADALNCRLVYTLVPRTKSFSQLIEQQAQQVAHRQVTTINHTMQLENQGININTLKTQEKNVSQELLQRAWKYLWDEDV